MKKSTITTVLILTAAIAGCGKQSEETAAAPSAPTAAAAFKKGNKPVELKNLEEVKADENCGINSPAVDSTHKRSANLSTWGYAFDKATWTVPANPIVRFTSLDSDSKLLVPLERGPREDVAKAFNQPGILNSGFGATVDLSELQPGRYQVAILQEVDGKYSVCTAPGAFLLQ